MTEFKGTIALDADWCPPPRLSSITRSARYGTLERWAEQLGLNDAVRLLTRRLTQEKNTDEALTGTRRLDGQTNRPKAAE